MIIPSQFITENQSVCQGIYLMLILMLLIGLTLVSCNTRRRTDTSEQEPKKKVKNKERKNELTDERKADVEKLPSQSRPTHGEKRVLHDRRFEPIEKKLRDTISSTPTNVTSTADLSSTPTPATAEIPANKKAAQTDDKSKLTAKVSPSVPMPVFKVVTLSEIIQARKALEEKKRAAHPEAKLAEKQSAVSKQTSEMQMQRAPTVEDVLEGRAVAPCSPAYETFFAVLPELEASQRAKNSIFTGSEAPKAQQSAGFKVINSEEVLNANKQPWKLPTPVKRSQKEVAPPTEMPQGPTVNDVLEGKAVAPYVRDYETLFAVLPDTMNASLRKDVKK